jgi:Na+-driven multidrug efflux pump
MGLAAIVALTLGDYLLRLFLNSKDPAELVQEIGAGKQRLYLFAFTYVLDGIMDVCGSYARGMKYSTPPAVITFFGCTVSRIIFLLTIFKLPEFHTVFWLYAAFPISWVIVDLVYIPVTLVIEKKAFGKLATRPIGDGTLETGRM